MYYILSIFTAHRVTIRTPKEAISKSWVAKKGDGNDEDEGANGARLSLQEEPCQVQDQEHDVVVQKGRVHWLWKQQDRDQPLKTVHDGLTTTTIDGALYMYNNYYN